MGYSIARSYMRFKSYAVTLVCGNETLSEIAPKYIGNTGSTCEAGVHSLVGNCKMKFVQELSAIHMRYVQTI